MGRTLTFDFRRGAGGILDMFDGEAKLEATRMYSVDFSVVLPSSQVVEINDGLGQFLDVQPSPAGPLPSWCYKFMVTTVDGFIHSFLVGVPSGTGPISFNELPFFDVAAPEPSSNIHDLASRAVNAETAAEGAFASAAAAAALVEAPADEIIAMLAQNPASSTHGALDSVIGDAALRKDTSTLIAGTGAGASMPANYDIGSTGTVVALGHNAMGKMTGVKKGIAIGTHAMAEGLHTRDSIAIGEDSLRFVSSPTDDYSTDPSGTRNVAVGGNTGRFVTNGSAHTFVGRNAGQNVVGAQGIVAIGNGAQASRCPVGLSGKIENWGPLGLGLTSTANVASVGNWAGSRNTSLDLAAFGAYALTNSVKSNKNTGIGTSALRRVDEDKWLDGTPLETKNLTGTYSHVGNVLTLSFPSDHGAIVDDVLIFKMTTGDSMTFGNDNVFAVVTSVPSSTVVVVDHPISRVASGGAVLVQVSKQSATTTYSDENTGVGSAAGAFFNGGNANTFIGANSGIYVKTGGANTALGQNAMAGISEAAVISVSDNTAVGQASLFKISNGMTGNTALGYRTGLNLISGADNTFFGRMAGSANFDSSPLTSVTNSTALGAGSTVSGNNQVQLGSSATTTYAYGAVQNRSDARDKADVRDTELGLDFINKLRPVDFRWDMRDDYKGAERDGSKKRSRFHHGLIAQEVAKVIEATGQDFGGFQDHAVSGGSDVLSIGYDELIAPIIKAIQQINERVLTLEEAV